MHAHTDPRVHTRPNRRRRTLPPPAVAWHLSPSRCTALPPPVPTRNHPPPPPIPSAVQRDVAGLARKRRVCRPTTRKLLPRRRRRRRVACGRRRVPPPACSAAVAAPVVGAGDPAGAATRLPWPVASTGRRLARLHGGGVVARRLTRPRPAPARCPPLSFSLPTPPSRPCPFSPTPTPATYARGRLPRGGSFFSFGSSGWQSQGPHPPNPVTRGGAACAGRWAVDGCGRWP